MPPLCTDDGARIDPNAGGINTLMFGWGSCASFYMSSRVGSSSLLEPALPALVSQLWFLSEFGCVYVGWLSDCSTVGTEEEWLSVPEKSTRQLPFPALGPGTICGPDFHVWSGTGERKRSCLMNQVLVSLFLAMLSTLEVVFEYWFWYADPPPPE